MVNYQLGKIYRIVCNTTGLTYYGSTCEDTMAKRLSHHKDSYKRYLNGNYGFTTSFEILKNENYEIILVENFPCNSKDQLHARERFYIESNECVNKIIPTRTKKEYREQNKEEIAKYQKQYREQNKEEIPEKMKQYREQNKELIKEINKQYREQNQETIAEYQKQYREENKDKFSEKNKQYYEANKKTILEKAKKKYMCVCGSVFRIGLKTRHFKSQKHQKYQEENNV